MVKSSFMKKKRSEILKTESTFRNSGEVKREKLKTGWAERKQLT